MLAEPAPERVAERRLDLAGDALAAADSLAGQLGLDPVREARLLEAQVPADVRELLRDRDGLGSSRRRYERNCPSSASTSRA